MSWKRGQWLAICDVCGFQFLSGKLKQRWDGLMVDEACFETQHPQEFIRPVRESTIPWSAPPSELNISPTDYIDSGYFLTYGTTGLPGEYITRTIV
jgi:hypothetical protein